MKTAQQRTPHLRSWRFATRTLVLVTALLLLGPFSHWHHSPSIPAALSPFVAAASTLATRSIHALAWLGLLVGAWAVVRRRFFCRWLCPTGLVVDGACKLGQACGRRPAGAGKTGVWLVWLTLGAALFGLPLFLWLDPLAIFSAAASLPRPDAGLARWYAAAMLLVLLLLSLARPGLWCRNLCPLGAFQEILHDGPRAAVRRMRSSRQAPQESPRGPAINRRTWLGLAGGGVSAVVLPRAPGGTQPLLRPPGALPEPAFNGVCLRCGNCLRACPSGIIGNAGRNAGLLRLFTPTVSFESDYCREDCVRCGEVCPSGALQSIAPTKKAEHRIGLAQVDMDLCLRADEQECSYCRNWCPYDAIRYVFNEEDYLVHPRVDPDRCNGCGACEPSCPVSPDKAITIVPRANPV